MDSNLDLRNARRTCIADVPFDCLIGSFCFDVVATMVSIGETVYVGVEARDERAANTGLKHTSSRRTIKLRRKKTLRRRLATNGHQNEYDIMTNMIFTIK
jgi:hypothetical protein